MELASGRQAGAPQRHRPSPRHSFPQPKLQQLEEVWREPVQPPFHPCSIAAQAVRDPAAVPTAAPGAAPPGPPGPERRPPASWSSKRTAAPGEALGSLQAGSDRQGDCSIAQALSKRVRTIASSAAPPFPPRQEGLCIQHPGTQQHARPGAAAVQQPQPPPQRPCPLSGVRLSRLPPVGEEAGGPCIGQVAGTAQTLLELPGVQVCCLELSGCENVILSLGSLCPLASLGGPGCMMQAFALMQRRWATR